MKRKKIVTADDGDTRVTITIQIDAKPALMRSEVSEMAENLASNIMAQIPHTRYLSIPLSRIRTR